MGVGTSLVDWVDRHRRRPPPIIGNIGTPAYCIKKIGSRHLLLAGGGGAARTGVRNEIETHLLSFKSDNKLAEFPLFSECVDQYNTDTFATMNMDVACLNNPEDGRYLIAAGHNEFCALYMTRGFKLAGVDVQSDADKRLSFEIQPVGRVRTDHHSKDSFQKCVRFDRHSRGRILATGGADGHIRVWDAMTIGRRSEDGGEPKPIHTIQAHKSDVDDLDFSFDSSILISVGNDGNGFLWDAKTGQLVVDVPFPIEIARGYKMRSARCTNLGAASNNTVFVAAYNSVSRTSRDMACFLALWAYNPQRKHLRPVVVKRIASEAISSLAVTECGNYTAIGTMSGGVGIFDTHDFRQLLYSPETHGIFVTGLEFLDRTANDTTQVNEKGQKVALPGPAAGLQACLVSLSADQSVQAHPLPYPQRASITAFLLKLSILSLVFYLIFWFFL